VTWITESKVHIVTVFRSQANAGTEHTVDLLADVSNSTSAGEWFSSILLITDL